MAQHRIQRTGRGGERGIEGGSDYKVKIKIEREKVREGRVSYFLRLLSRERIISDTL